MSKPLVLCILDGVGINKSAEHNAVKEANTPNLDRMMTEYPMVELSASGGDVGLPKGQMGNSEVGHMNIGAGRVVKQLLPRIEEALETDTLKDNETFKKLSNTEGACHVVGLMSPGGVHSHQKHIIYMANALAASGTKVILHGILDGRDTPPQSAMDFMNEIKAELAEGIIFGTLSGRYYTMDRNNNWDRIEKAYNAMIMGIADNTAADTTEAIEKSYGEGITDEFMLPTVIGEYNGINDGDTLLIANYRADRVRQIATALVAPEFEGFERKQVINFAAKIGMASYSEALDSYFETLFPPQKLENILGKVLADNGLKQLRLAETEKYAHVTFFFNGGEEAQFEGEGRTLIESPAVATYDLKPEMSAVEITDALEKEIDQYDVIIMNYANGDMVGHTGSEPAAIIAMETVDQCVARVEKMVNDRGGKLLITADHGNCEKMMEDGKPLTAHTTSPVPFIVIGAGDVTLAENGKLADIAPTMLTLLDVEIPSEMTGKSLV